MPAKKKTTASEPAEPGVNPTPEPAVSESQSAVTGGIAAEDLEVLNGDIDERMAALLKDHQEMGSRPK